jgi:hypothetical protein
MVFVIPAFSLRIRIPHSDRVISAPFDRHRFRIGYRHLPNAPMSFTDSLRLCSVRDREPVALQHPQRRLATQPSGAFIVVYTAIAVGVSVGNAIKLNGRQQAGHDAAK